MKSYISRKLPLTTRKTDLNFDSFADIACEDMNLTFSKDAVCRRTRATTITAFDSN
ncbi:hypothetical protein BSU04_10380 [Caballeronia sordidicola]|uniref:Uncharacterized protein n=1 Tax=Caballeronia sordidicola TaxID=196367 RepID=A0A226X5F5_CABSO|nr:hypothetical protein BSU04_10380 [Caballeronia sordidicola]